MNRKTPLYVVTMFVLLWSCSAAHAANVAETCTIEITGPKAGQEVAGHVNVNGNATFPANLHLWVFARRTTYRKLNVWWPQGEVDSTGGTWELPDITLGGPQDVSYQFDVIAAVFDSAGHTTLQNYFQNSMKSGDYQPIPMPGAVCSAAAVTVKKTQQ
jgi:hypothetical protein